jgi:hypothetical protein
MSVNFNLNLTKLYIMFAPTPTFLDFKIPVGLPFKVCPGPPCTRNPAIPGSRVSPGIKGSPKWFLAKWVFGGLGYQGKTKTRVQEKNGFLALPPSAARPENHSFLENVWVFGFGTPGLQKNTWPKNHFGIPLNNPPTLISVGC